MNATATAAPPAPAAPPTASDDVTDDVVLDIVTSALSDTTRRGLLRLVRQDERSAGALAAEFPDISRPAVSQHLRVLHDAGLVAVRSEGNRRLYRARSEALAPVSRFIDEMWDDRLRRLKRAAERIEHGRIESGGTT